MGSVSAGCQRMDPARRGHGWMALQRPGRPDAARPDGRADLRAAAAASRQHTDRLDGPADRGANPLPIAVLINRSPHTDRHGDAETKPQATIILVRRGTVERAGREPAGAGRPECVERVPTRPMTGLNPLTWCAWALAAIAAALMERNPYLQLLLLAILLTVWIAARHDRSIGYWRAALVLGLLPLLFSLVFSRFGSHVLFGAPPWSWACCRFCSRWFSAASVPTYCSVSPRTSRSSAAPGRWRLRCMAPAPVPPCC